MNNMITIFYNKLFFHVFRSFQMKKLTCLLTLVLIALFAYEASAQDFTNNIGGTYTACATGKIVMRLAGANGITTGIFTGTAPMGLVTSRIPGIVDWGAGAAGQVVQNRYYTDLTVSGGAKTLADAYISGVYTIAVGAGNRTYGTGTIHYDGTTLTQDITSESGASAGTNRYYNLVFEGSGTKIVQAASTVFADNSLQTLPVGGSAVATTVNGILEIGKSATATASTINGAFSVSGATAAFKNGNSATGFVSTFDIAAGGTVSVDANGDATLNAASTVTLGNLNLVAGGTAKLIVANGGSLTLANDLGGLAKIDIAGGKEMTVTGSYTNLFCAATNATYNVSSIVHYNGALAQAVATTVATNPYGNLWTDGGDKTLSACAFPAGVYVAGDLSLAGGNLYLGNAATAAASTSTLYISDITKKVIYNDPSVLHGALLSADGPTEVVGAMRLLGGAGFATGTPYRFNNHGMLATFTGGTFAAGNYFEVLSLPGTAPRNYDPTKDLNRKISLRYSAAPMAFTATVQAGYKVSDRAWAENPYYENEFRFWESRDVPNLAIEKIATGFAYTRVIAGTIHTVSLPGITETAADIDAAPIGNADAGFLSTNDLILRAGPTIFYSIRDGRWSNPATWDEGAQPGANDDAVVRHTVHAGYPRLSDAMYALPEQHPLTLVKNITINDVAGSSLLWGGGAGIGDVSIFNLTATGSITNNSKIGGTMAPSGGNDVTSTAFNGMSIFTLSTMRTNNLFNNGLMNNCGTVEIGD